MIASGIDRHHCTYVEFVDLIHCMTVWAVVFKSWSTFGSMPSALIVLRKPCHTLECTLFRPAVNCFTSRPSIVVFKQVSAIRLSLNFNGSVYSTMELGSVYSTFELSDSIEHFILQDAAAAGLFRLMELDAGLVNVPGFVAVVVVDATSSRDCKT